MVAEIVVAPAVKWIAGTALRGIFGDREGLPLARNPLFGPIARAIVASQQPPVAPLAPPAPIAPAPLAPPPAIAPAPPIAPAPLPGPDLGLAPSPGFPGYVPEVLPPMSPPIVPAPAPAPMPDTMPLPSSVPAVLGRVLGTIGMIFWPSRTASDDTWGDWWPEPEVIPKGPPKRPRVRRPQPYGWPLPDFQGKWRRGPRVPGVIYPDYSEPYVEPRPTTGDPWAAPGTRPATRPGSRPGARPGTRPGTGTGPAPGTEWPDIWPFFVPTVTPRPTMVPQPQPQPRPPAMPDPWTPPAPAYPSPSNPFGPSPLTPSEPRGVDLPSEFAQPFQFRTDRCPPCDCTKSKRKRKKDSCTNPISSKRTFTRGSTRYRTITRKLQCQV